LKNILIKVSGDLLDSDEFFDFACEKARNNYVVVICGGGTQVNRELEKHGIVPYFENGRRITRTLKERKIAREVLWKLRDDLQDKFVGKGVWVVSPYIQIASVECPINGDDMVKACYLGFDEIYVFTKKERIEKKKKVFENFKKVKIVGV